MAVSVPRSMEAPLLRLRALDGRAGWVLLGALWLVTRLIYLLNVMLGHHYPDDAFFVYAQRFSDGLLPYRNFPVEYPPLGMLFIILPGMVHAGPLTEWGYATSFALEMLALDVLTLFLVIRLARVLIPGDISGVYSGLLYTGFVAASGAIAQKFDLVAGTFCLLGVVALMRRRDGLAWMMLVLATLTKGFPLALAPLFILYRLLEGRAGYRGLYDGLRAALVSSAVVTIPLVLMTGIQPLIHAVIYHVDRGIEIESMYAGLMLLGGRLFGLATASYANPADLSQDILSPLDSLVNGIAVPLGVLLIGFLYWQFYRTLKARPEERNTTLIRFTLLVMLAFMITFRALPGHYLLAILPLAALVRFQGWRQRAFVLTLLGALLLGQLETVVWSQLLVGQWIGILALVARNGAILASFALLFGGRMRRFMPEVQSASRMVTKGLPKPKPSLGWAVESGVRSWQEVPAPFDSYKERETSRSRATTLLPAQYTYLSQTRHHIV
jgi:hypothetical protein